MLGQAVPASTHKIRRTSGADNASRHAPSPRIKWIPLCAHSADTGLQPVPRGVHADGSHSALFPGSNL